MNYYLCSYCGTEFKNPFSFFFKASCPHCGSDDLKVVNREENSKNVYGYDEEPKDHD